MNCALSWYFGKSEKHQIIQDLRIIFGVTVVHTFYF